MNIAGAFWRPGSHWQNGQDFPLPLKLPNAHPDHVLCRSVVAIGSSYPRRQFLGSTIFAGELILFHFCGQVFYAFIAGYDLSTIRQRKFVSSNSPTFRALSCTCTKIHKNSPFTSIEKLGNISGSSYKTRWLIQAPFAARFPGGIVISFLSMLDKLSHVIIRSLIFIIDRAGAFGK